MRVQAKPLAIESVVNENGNQELQSQDDESRRVLPRQTTACQGIERERPGRYLQLLPGTDGNRVGVRRLFTVVTGNDRRRVVAGVRLVRRVAEQRGEVARRERRRERCGGKDDEDPCGDASTHGGDWLRATEQASRQRH